MNTITSFPPITEKSAKILILGSMPGALSLNANQYYAHPRNAFWRIMGSLYGFDAESAYEYRVERLTESGVAVWDVLHTCVRAGSLDSAIESRSQIANDFQLFFKQHPNIKLVGFNGEKAEKSFNKLCLPLLNISDINFVRLPSSSPAHTLPLAQKVAAWRKALEA
ncbi:DNA-deoxyinosine glycosylase [Methylotenera sp. L2L1]|uniref:DNA-deoxyinosine glycosylase n=1 Tax=Methylotenera sp. L2L1 TaxID=1502770 RepID=UPI0009E0384D|nr:DNA-deoxyinosine glycosylase [Methylotenera sp. L2L1]